MALAVPYAWQFNVVCQTGSGFPSTKKLPSFSTQHACSLNLSASMLSPNSLPRC